MKTMEQSIYYNVVNNALPCDGVADHRSHRWEKLEYAKHSVEDTFTRKRLTGTNAGRTIAEIRGLDISDYMITKVERTAYYDEDGKFLRAEMVETPVWPE